jgi:YfiH family protein
MTSRLVQGNEKSDFPVILPLWPALPKSVHAFATTRFGGVSLGPFGNRNGLAGLNLGAHVGDDVRSVIRNREILDSYLPSPVRFMSQVHGNTVLDAALMQGVPIADACFTSRAAVVCAVLTADCLPVLLSDAQGVIVAAAHAGWRGLANGVLQETVKKMRRSGATEIIAWLGPAIGPAQFEVGQDVFDAFSKILKIKPEHFILRRSENKIINKSENKYLANMYALARTILSEVGVDRVDGGSYCTVAEPDQFYSYRRDGITGRMASLIWID